ncbi:XK-related protein 6-like isoform X2 [Amphiura filiformis]|uniref:XK-related protein 6-like isoform X2 n=1 Tax=Amphiura filiformis TaxID=82378 RepID=UPI003B225883
MLSTCLFMTMSAFTIYRGLRHKMKDAVEIHLPLAVLGMTRDTQININNGESQPPLDKCTDAEPSDIKDELTLDMKPTEDAETKRPSGKMASVRDATPKQPQVLAVAPDTVIAEPISDHFQVDRSCSKSSFPNSSERLLPLVTTALLYVFNIGTGIAAGSTYLANGHTLWGGLTLGLVAISLIATNCLSLYHYRKVGTWKIWHVRRRVSEDEQSERILQYGLYHTNRVWFVARVIFHILQFGMLYRILYQLVNRKACQRSVQEFIHKLRFWESFVESAPQTILQITIMTVIPDGSGVYWITVISALASLSSLVWVVRSHYKLYLINTAKDRYPWCTEMNLLVSPLLTLPARLISMALFMSHYTWIIIPVIGIHWVVTAAEAIYSARKLRATRDVKTNCLRCIVTLFIYLAGERSIFGKFPWLYDLLLLVENTVLFLAWFVVSGSKTGYGLPILGLVWGGFIVGVVLKLRLFDTKRLLKYITL